jgi:hypothetical protein
MAFSSPKEETPDLKPVAIGVKIATANNGFVRDLSV